MALLAAGRRLILRPHVLLARVPELPQSEEPLALELRSEVLEVDPLQLEDVDLRVSGLRAVIIGGLEESHPR